MLIARGGRGRLFEDVLVRFGEVLRVLDGNSKCQRLPSSLSNRDELYSRSSSRIKEFSVASILVGTGRGSKV